MSEPVFIRVLKGNLAGKSGLRYGKALFGGYECLVPISPTKRIDIVLVDGEFELWPDQQDSNKQKSLS